ncbi:P2X receptor [Cavenderia fasciculata]|uniref:P2X receptor n=1 Tax=Cavenderia fasciculata TaxID=261658 RepID=F4Q1Q4_CACFS|nr:P2X receptor [Cavenderia fasciculata]EGG18204.1 P2X receptor [Cavenderia fasciculata]|eukprot:XP_004357027.1 P2X receptor [Cavenderia fasciculata]
MYFDCGTLDDWLSYNTVKVVRIRDRRLGILHLTFLLGIFVYVVVVSIFMNKGYLEVEIPIGSIRTSLKPPVNYTYPLPYCGNQPGFNSTLFHNITCQYWDENLVVFPIGERDSFTASTRVKTSSQHADGCDFTNPNCTYTEDDPNSIFIADIENFTLLIDHTLYAPQSKVQKNSQQLSGYIENEEGDLITLDVCVLDGVNSIGISGQPDIVTLGKILQFAGISLDDRSLTNASNSMRYDGVNIFVFITYSNTYSTNLDKYRYVYSVSVIENTEYSVVEPIYQNDIQHRYLYRRHGIRLLFVQTGEVGKFEFQQLLLTLVSGMGLLAVSTIVVDQLAIRILPQKKTYSSFKFQVTEGLKGSKMKKVVTNDEGEDIVYKNIEDL